MYNALHGGEGGNGQIQSYLSHHNIPFTGSDSMASMLAMNKHFTKIISDNSIIVNSNKPNNIGLCKHSSAKTISSIIENYLDTYVEPPYQV